MESILLSVLMTILATLGMGILLIYIIFKQRYTYWDDFDIAVKRPQFPYGSLGSPFNKTSSAHTAMADVYKYFKKNKQKQGGIYVYCSPLYVAIDPVIVKNILIKDFNYFSERLAYYNKKSDPFSFTILTTSGQEWKDMRTKLTPLFTINKLKTMFPLLQIHNDRFVKKIDDYVKRMEPVEIKNLAGCMITDIIGSCSLGVECNSLEYPNCNFRKFGKRLFHFSLFRLLKATFSRGFPNLARSLGLVVFPRDVSHFFMKIVDEVVDYRIKNNIKYNDFLQSIMELEKSEKDERVKRTNIAVQSTVLFSAGFDSTSSTLTDAVYELGCNPEIQEKLRKEVTSVLERHNGVITYEALIEMEYLNRVIDETLRKYPAVSILFRKCAQDYHVEGTNITIEKGVIACISILGIHMDPEYYPNPEVFDPERFTEINKSKRPPCTYLPFIEGPRNCIALKFGLLQVKLALANILKNFKFSINSKTGIPVMDSKAFTYRFSSDIYVDFEKI
ncbi:probable cytochrome P450 6a23 [Agrilus planipennis]|uniref:Probable cytochrome P450 6a23 n=1 Tax=Agrilus planipennis TaxID=224129 RepID=A0A7F5QY35_AGRPL|nr:probable cytochrome P450 6a23 [Agrilus planipennis]